ncbi:hypothetical protein BKE30_07160 [Alkanindiges hydrocarboniclasticus]|uniref:Uncharacterized protein n=1 Tax=Alkanindiges hydrocarboniclasticus TaxID=1907941 RepID=A0A1S8CUA0_9GAMM|nr:hypothetical protein BKE30_07160 [Alkanindiges hydrocarboniclasticus]
MQYKAQEYFRFLIVDTLSNKTGRLITYNEKSLINAVIWRNLIDRDQAGLQQSSNGCWVVHA